MTITTTQKIIKIGTSKGVTIPAKQLQALNLSEGDEVRVIVEPIHRDKDLSTEYADFKEQYGETLKNLSEVVARMRYFTAEEILRLHFMLIEDYGGSHGVRDEGRLKSLVEAPQSEIFGIEQYGTIYEKAAVYMRNCIADHLFVDGNKRTGTTLAGIFLGRNNSRLTATPIELEDFAVDVAVKHLEVSEIAVWLEQHSKKA